MWKINIDIRSFYEQFVKEYEFLYDNDDMVAGYTEAVEAFDDFVKWFPEFVREFARFRGDFISSNREAAAFMFALDVFMDDGAVYVAARGRKIGLINL